ncbi:hypothetical protein BH11BAC1_BH11BAC1_09340 [soil metagenome]
MKKNSYISIIIKEYAYNVTPNQFILAGDTSTIPTGIIQNTIQAENFTVSPNPANNSITIKFLSEEEGTVQILNLFGQVVFLEKINAEQTQIDVSKFPSGMYAVR